MRCRLRWSRWFTISRSIRNGTFAELLAAIEAVLPPAYYAMMVPQLLRTDPRELTPLRRAELDRFGAACRTEPKLAGMVETLFDRLFSRPRKQTAARAICRRCLIRIGFDREQHERIRTSLRNGRIGLAQNRLPASTTIQDVQAGRCGRHHAGPR